MISRNLTNPKIFWYTIGLITTDGNLSKDGRHIDITSKDEKDLKRLKEALGLKCKIGKKNRGQIPKKFYSRLAFGDVNFYKELLDIGLTPRKSLSLKSLNIDPNYFCDFLRGVIDGDGCIFTWIHPSNSSRQWSLRIISAAPIFLKWLHSEIENTFNVRGRFYERHNPQRENAIYFIKFGKLASKIILANSYYPKSLAFERKAGQVRRCLQDQNRMVNYGGVLGPGAETGIQN